MICDGAEDAMILAVDAGNSNLVLGVFESGALRVTLRLPSDRQKSAAEYLCQLRGLLLEQGVAPERAVGCILSSVVPGLTPVLSAVLHALTGKTALVVGPALAHGLVIRNYNPAELGSDRIVDAVAALAVYPPPLAIFDLGTATTLSVLDRDGALIGGMILAGLRLATEALTARAAQLPPVELTAPRQLLGADPVSCMQSGAIYGTAAMLDGITQRVESELGQPVTLVVTGGLSHLVVPHCRHALHHEEHLLLRGLYLLFQRSAPPTPPASPPCAPNRFS